MPPPAFVPPGIGMRIPPPPRPPPPPLDAPTSRTRRGVEPGLRVEAHRCLLLSARSSGDHGRTRYAADAMARPIH